MPSPFTKEAKKITPDLRLPEQLHKSITETLNTAKIAKRFACANERRKGL